MKRTSGGFAILSAENESGSQLMIALTEQQLRRKNQACAAAVRGSP